MSFFLGFWKYRLDKFKCKEVVIRFRIISVVIMRIMSVKIVRRWSLMMTSLFETKCVTTDEVCSWTKRVWTWTKGVSTVLKNVQNGPTQGFISLT